MRGCRSPTKLLSFHIDIVSFFFCNFAGAMMPVIIDTRVPRHTGLNRTFYGIETTKLLTTLSMIWNSLNRTFYGIETSVRA